MPFDGIVISSIVTELNQKIQNGRIEKIYQPESDEITLLIRAYKEKYKLLITSNSSHPRIHLTHEEKLNPSSPPMFCMLLRKHLQGGKVLAFRQREFERIIEMDIESRNELGDICIRQLIIEIMGKHSNIILLDPVENKIMDSIKRIGSDINRYRELLPGKTYMCPPSQEKKNPLTLNFDFFLDTLRNFSASKPIYKGIYQSLQGISPIAAQEICFRSHIDAEKAFLSLHQKEHEVLFNNLLDLIHLKFFQPKIFMDGMKNVVDFYPTSLTQYDSIYTHTDLSSVSEMLEQYYERKDLFNRIKQKSTDLRKYIHHTLQKLYKKKQKLKEELKTATKADKYKIYGELLTAYLYLVKKGDEQVEVDNFYTSPFTKIQIPLNKNLTPSQNAQKFFKRYNKLKTAQLEITHQLKDTDEEILYFENLMLSIESAETLIDIDDIRLELIEQGYLKRRKSSKGKKNKQVSKPLSFLSSDGFTILVGKNNKQNDQLTLKTASKQDYWFHTKDIPGSHVVILKNGKKDIPQSTLLEAAQLAAYHSKGKLSSNVAIDYTEIRNVKKPSGAKPGMVIYVNYHTLYVTPKATILEKLRK